MFISTSQIYLLIASLQYYGVQALPFRESSETDLVPRASLAADLLDESISGLAQDTKGLSKENVPIKPFFQHSKGFEPVFGRPSRGEKLSSIPEINAKSQNLPANIPPPNIASSIKLQPQSGLTPKPNVPNNPRKSGGDNIFLNQVGTEGLSGVGGLSNTGKVAAGSVVAATGIGAVAGGAALVNNMKKSQSSSP